MGSKNKNKKSYLHSHGEYSPDVLLNLVHFNRVINLLLCASEEAAESVDAFVVDGAGA